MLFYRLVCLSSSAFFTFGALAHAQPANEEKKYPNEVYFDFRGKSLPEDLMLTPAGSDRFVKSEPEGLRITLPKDRKNLAPVVVGTRLGIQGDFEITATLEILQADRPKGGFGVGASLFINKADPAFEGATVGRLVKPDGNAEVFWDRGFGKTKEGLQFDIDQRPCSETKLRLRLKRTGARLAYFLGKGFDTDVYEALPPKEFGGNDIEKVIVRVSTGQQPMPVDVRLIDLRIRSGAAPATPIPVAAATVESSRGWLLAALFALVVILFIIVVVFAVLLSRRKNTETGKPRTPA
jgi:hypothetical protein